MQVFQSIQSFLSCDEFVSVWFFALTNSASLTECIVAFTYTFHASRISRSELRGCIAEFCSTNLSVLDLRAFDGPWIRL